MDDNIFESMLASIREYKEINVNIGKGAKGVVERVPAIAENFSKHATSLVVSNFPEEDVGLVALLRSQPMLRRLNCESIGSVAFEELCRMQDLEFLRARFHQEVAGELNNLKELNLEGQILILRKVFLPKLEKLTLGKYHSVKSEDFVALSLSAQNLQYVESKVSETGFLPAIIDNFPALNTLFVNSRALAALNVSRPPPSKQNQSVEELIIWKPLYPAPIELIVDVVNACPNIKRMQLYGVTLSDSQILEMIRSNPHLTHFWFGATYFDLFRRRDVITGSLDPVLTEIIHVFRDSPNFVSLSFWGIVDQPVEDYLSQDTERIIVLKFSKTPFRTCLQMTKKSDIAHSFDKFDKHAESFFSSTKNLRPGITK